MRPYTAENSLTAPDKPHRISSRPSASACGKTSTIDDEPGEICTSIAVISAGPGTSGTRRAITVMGG